MKWSKRKLGTQKLCKEDYNNCCCSTKRSLSNTSGAHIKNLVLGLAVIMIARVDVPVVVIGGRVAADGGIY